MDDLTKEQTGMLFVHDKPKLWAIKDAYDNCIDEVSDFIFQARRSYDSRRNKWVGKSDDMRKHGATAFPWDGAADTEAHVIDERIDAFVSLFISSMDRANIRAYPSNGGDIQQARVVSSFLKWMKSNYIPRFRQEMELAANYLLERGVAITYVGWNREERTYLQKFSLEAIAAQMPDLARKILDKENDPEITVALQGIFPRTSQKRIKKALNTLRKTGFAEMAVSRREVDCPVVDTLAPDGDFFFPAWVSDPQRAPYCFWRTYMTAQELKGKVLTDGWDEEWVDEVIKMASQTTMNSNTARSAEGRTEVSYVSGDLSADLLVEVIYTYQRLIDAEDGSEGIYCTVWCYNYLGGEDDPHYGKFELMSGYEDYPVVATRLSESSKRFYDTQSMAERLRGIQDIVKVERDSRIDRNSMATLPPIMHPVGNPPSEWGPGRRVPYRRGGEFQFGPVPQYNAGSQEIERTLLELADKGIGLNAEDPLSASKRQFYVDKFLEHVQRVLALAFKCFQRFGPDEVYFRVTGQPDSQKFTKGDPEQDYDITIMFDVMNNDPETAEKRLQTFASLFQFDTSGVIDKNEWLSMMLSSIDPVIADRILQPAQAGQQQITKQVTEDLTQIFAGIERPAPPNGGQVAMQVLQQYASQPDVQQRLMSDEAFKGRIEKYAKQIQFIMQQAQNAQIGKIGTAPAAMGGIQTQGMQ